MRANVLSYLTLGWRTMILQRPITLGLTMLMLSATSQGAVVTYQATGVVTSINITAGSESIFPSVALGDAFSVQWTFDNALEPCTDWGGSRRYCPIPSMTVIVGGTSRTFSTYRDDHGYQDITFDTFLSAWTWFGIEDSGGHFDRVTGTTGIYWGSPESGPLAGSGLNIPGFDDLPMPAFDGQGRLTYQHAVRTPFTSRDTDDFTGSLSYISAVPVPPALALFASACALFVGMRRMSTRGIQ